MRTPFWLIVSLITFDWIGWQEELSRAWQEALSPNHCIKEAKITGFQEKTWPNTEVPSCEVLEFFFTDNHKVLLVPHFLCLCQQKERMQVRTWPRRMCSLDLTVILGEIAKWCDWRETKGGDYSCWVAEMMKMMGSLLISQWARAVASLKGTFLRILISSLTASLRAIAKPL